MFHALLYSPPKMLLILYAPGQITHETRNGPSHGKDSLWPLLKGGDPSEDEITYNKRTFTYPSGMVAVMSLLVPGRSHDGGVSLFLEHVNIGPALFLSPLLVVEVDTRGRQSPGWRG